MKRKQKKIYKVARSAEEKLKALKLLRNSTIDFVAARYHISERSLYRWKKLYDGTLESLENKFSRKDMLHPNRHTDEEIKNITKYLFLQTVPTTKDMNGKTKIIIKNEKGTKFKIAKKATVIAVIIEAKVKFSIGFTLFFSMFILKL